MNLLEKWKIIGAFLILLMIGSGVAGAFNHVPEATGSDAVTPDVTRFDLGNGTWVDVEVNGNITRMVFSDDALILVNASEEFTSIQIWENFSVNKFQQLILESNVPAVPLPSPFMNSSVTVPAITVQEIEEGNVTTEFTQMSYASPSPSEPSFTYLRSIDNRKSQFQYSDFILAWNQSGVAGQIGTGSLSSPTMPFTSFANLLGLDALTNSNYTVFSFEYFADQSRPFGPFLANLTEVTTSYSMESVLLTQQSNNTSYIDSFFNVSHTVGMPTGTTQTHEMNGATDGGNVVGSFFSYYNISASVLYSYGREVGTPPVADRIPPVFDNPNLPYDVVDIVITSSSVEYIFGGFTLALFLDKLVINYLTFSGFYIPIIIYYETLQIHIIIEQITIIVYLEITELIVVIIIYEIVKIEIYINYIVIVIEIFKIYIIEITMWFIDITVVIDISITLTIWVINIKIIKKIIWILPIWIWIIPIYIPVPILIPIPTPVPYLIPITDVDLVDQEFNEVTGLMNLTYFVSDEYGYPIVGATVTVEIDDGTGPVIYNAVEDPLKFGYYEVQNVVLEPNAHIKVVADASPRPLGILEYDQSEVPSTDTILVNSTVISTVTNSNANTITVNTTHTVTETQTVNGTDSNTNSAPLTLTEVIVGVFISTVAILERRRRKFTCSYIS